MKNKVNITKMSIINAVFVGLEQEILLQLVSFR